MVSVMNPGEMRNAPATRINAPSLSSRPGSSPLARRSVSRCSTARPDSRTR